MKFRRWMLWAGHAVAALATLGLAPSLAAQPLPTRAEYNGGEPPGRVGRVAELSGSLWIYEADGGAWVSAERNQPLTQGDRVSVDADGRAELRIGPTVLRLGGGTELAFRRLDDERLQFELVQGTVALRVPSRDHAQQTEMFTAEGRWVPLRAGHYRFDRVDDTSSAGAWRGELQFSGQDNVMRIDEGERFEVWRDGPGLARTKAVGWPADRLAAWAQAADRSAPRSVAQQYVSPEMTGAEDLDRWGRWDEHPEHGMVWLPRDVAPGWAPFRDGRWVWQRPWGWTWVDAAPWGFAPFHYGRWVQWRGHWAWWPGYRHARLVYAPAVVGWVGSPSVGVSIQIGHAPPPWVILAPHQPYVPIYRPPPPRHGHPVHPPPMRPMPPMRPAPSPRPPEQVPTGPVSYGADGVPSAVRPTGGPGAAAPGPGGPQAAPAGPAVASPGRPAPMMPAPPPAPMQVPGAAPGGMPADQPGPAPRSRGGPPRGDEPAPRGSGAGAPMPPANAAPMPPANAAPTPPANAAPTPRGENRRAPESAGPGPRPAPAAQGQRDNRSDVKRREDVQ